MTIIGYARVSTVDQTLDAQLEDLSAAGADRIFSEKESGAKSNRKELSRAIACLRAGDILLISRLDRLARSTRDLLNILAEVGGKNAGFRSLKDTWADTTSPHGRLIITILAGLAEFERELIKSRTGEGRQRAMERGVKMGRKPKLTPHQRREALSRRAAGESVVEIARSFAVAHTTISRLKA